MIYKPEKFVFYEGMSPRGHVELTKFYINSLKQLDAKVFIGSSLMEHYINNEQVIPFDDTYLLKGKNFSRLFFIINTLKVFLYCWRKGIKKVVVLSYNANVMFLLMWVANLTGLKVFCFEHNTVPGTSKIKRVLQKLCTSKLIRLCYTPQVLSYYEKLDSTGIYIPHPLLNINRNHLVSSCDFLKGLIKDRLIVFCPSGQSKIERVIKQAQANPDVYFIVKTQKKINLKNVKTERFFNNYYGVLNACDIVYLPIDFDYRVSGPFYEAVAFNKPILFDGEGLFQDYAKVKFSEQIINSFSKRINFEGVRSEEYNEDIKKRLFRAFHI